MSKATIVSFYPMPVNEFRPCLFPPRYHVPASNGVMPQVLVVDDAFYLVESPMESMPAIKVYLSGEDVARSIVADFTLASLHADSVVGPGVFVVSGEVKASDVHALFKKECTEALAKQRNWFLRLVKHADDDWQKFRQHKMITDLQRLAADQLKIDKEWTIISKEVISCPACKITVDPTAIVCQNCRCILQPEQFKKLQFA